MDRNEAQFYVQIMHDYELRAIEMHDGLDLVSIVAVCW